MSRRLPMPSVFLFWIFFQTPVTLVQASEAILPSARHYEIAEQGVDCGVYLAVLTRTKDEVEHQRRVEVAQREMLKKRRVELEACATARGVKDLASEEGEIEAARKCPASYRAWLSPGSRLRLTQADRADSEGGIRLVESHLKRHCPTSLTF